MPSKTLFGLAVIALSAAPIASTFAQEPDSAMSGTKLTAMLTPEAEVPPPGHAGAKGTFEVHVNAKTGRICAAVHTENLALGERMVHIHTGKPGIAGPVLVPFGSFSSDDFNNCRDVDKGIAQKLLAAPGDYYANVHDSDHAAGAIRGQLTK